MSDESGGVPRLPTLLASREREGVGGSGSDVRATVLIAEGLPPIPLKLFEKIKRWEFVDLSLLLHDSSSRAEELLLQQRGEKVMIVQSVEQAQRRRKQITDIFSWSKAFSIYCAALCSDEAISKEESVGLWAHFHLINQLSRDLGGSQWMAYDTDFREWAAAKGVRKWGEINLTIYGRCLAGRMILSNPQNSPVQSDVARKSRQAIKRGAVTTPSSKVCFQWNFEVACVWGEACKFSHICYYCEAPHKARDCKRRQGKRVRAGESPVLP